MHRSRCLVFLLSAVLYGFQQSAASVEIDKDAYAIYSLMLTNPKTSHGPDTNPRYLIADTTVPGVPETPCVAPPADRRGDFQEVLADYAKRKKTPRVLKRALSIRKPYVLLNAVEAEAFAKSRMQPQVPTDPPQVADDQFKDVADLFRLGDVYFNQDRTLALTSVSSWCGGLCGLWRWRVFEKLESGAWVERDWVGCSTIARANWTIDDIGKWAQPRLAVVPETYPFRDSLSTTQREATRHRGRTVGISETCGPGVPAGFI